ncbi:MAG: RICIN domain-containing protein [Butyrivibrio sp.]|nr:RICIN domain-containing protein [Butyrivibrio sp.]
MVKIMKRIGGLLTGVAMLACSLYVIPPISAHAEAITPESGNCYYIKSKNSGLYLTVENDSASKCANVIQSKGTGSRGQKWILEQNDSGTFRLHPATDTSGGMSLDVAYGSSKDATNVQIYSNNGQSAQNFKLIEADSKKGYYIATESSNFSSVLDVNRKSTSSGANVQQYRNLKQSNQTWYFEKTEAPSGYASGNRTGNTPAPAERSANVPTPAPSNESSSTDTPEPSNEDANTPAPGPSEQVQEQPNTQSDFKLDSSYPQQQVQFQNCSDGNYVTAGNGSVTTSNASNANNRWILDFAGNGSFRIVNITNGNCITANGQSVTSAPAQSNNSSQLWNIAAVKSDAYGTPLNYKIVSQADNNLALTLSGNSYALSSYNGSAGQCFRLNSYGAEGFAGYSLDMSKREKASVTGGVLGQVVEANSLSDLQKYASGSTPYTIVIRRDISANSLTKVSVGANKTFVGSYGAHTLNNIHFRNTSNSGNNIYKNITFSHSVNINDNDDIQMYITDGNNFWLDHCSWSGHDMSRDSNIHGNDKDKFLYVGLKSNFVSVTGCYFGGHKYGLILGYPEENGSPTYDGYPCMTICNCYFNGTQTRAPGLMRYGYFHCYNNFVYNFNIGYTPYTNCNIFSENNFFDKGRDSGGVVNDMGRGNFTDKGSVLSSDVSRLSIGGCNWRPSSNYGYKTRDAANAKSWVTSHAGSQNSSISYAID